MCSRSLEQEAGDNAAHDETAPAPAESAEPTAAHVAEKDGLDEVPAGADTPAPTSDNDENVPEPAEEKSEAVTVPAEEKVRGSMRHS